MSRYNRLSYLNDELMGACQRGDMNIVLEMIKKGANAFNCGLAHACREGHKVIALLMLENGADDVNWGMMEACMKGHKELVYLMIKNGADDWNCGLTNACYGQSEDLVSLMIEKGTACAQEMDLNSALNILSFLFIKRNIYLLLVEKGADINIANIKCDEEDILYLIKRGVTRFGKYTKLSEHCNLWLCVAKQELETIIIPDLAEIILTY